MAFYLACCCRAAISSKSHGSHRGCQKAPSILMSTRGNSAAGHRARWCSPRWVRSNRPVLRSAPAIHAEKAACRSPRRCWAIFLVWFTGLVEPSVDRGLTFILSREMARFSPPVDVCWRSARRFPVDARPRTGARGNASGTGSAARGPNAQRLEQSCCAEMGIA